MEKREPVRQGTSNPTGPTFATKAYVPWAQEYPHHSYAQQQAQGRVFSNAQDKLWSQYLADADTDDRRLTDGWKGDTDGILIFTGLFAATVATFATASYPLLFQDTGQATVALLLQMSQQQQSSSSSSAASVDASITSFTPPAYAVRVNIMWFLSLYISLFCALAATLVQQWARKYIADTQRRAPARKRGPIQVYLVMGVHRFGLAAAVDIIIALLHIAVFLFFAGLLDFLFAANREVAHTALGLVCALAAVYVALSVLPLVYHDCPYETPFTSVLRLFDRGVRLALGNIVSLVDRLLLSWRKSDSPVVPAWLRAALTPRPYRFRRELLEDKAMMPSNARMQYALSQAMRHADEDHELQEFLDGLINIIPCDLWENGDFTPVGMFLIEKEYLDYRLSQLIHTCSTRVTSGDLGAFLRNRMFHLFYQPSILSRDDRINRILSLNAVFTHLRTRIGPSFPQSAAVWPILAQDPDMLVSFLGFRATIEITSDDPPDPEWEDRWLWTISHAFELDMDTLAGPFRFDTVVACYHFFNILRLFRGVIQFSKQNLPSNVHVNPVHIFSEAWVPMIEHAIPRMHPDYVPIQGTTAYRSFHDFLCLLSLDDLLPDPDLRWPEGTERLDCGDVLERYPIIRKYLERASEVVRERADRSASPGLLLQTTNRALWSRLTVASETALCTSPTSSVSRASSLPPHPADASDGPGIPEKEKRREKGKEKEDDSSGNEKQSVRSLYKYSSLEKLSDASSAPPFPEPSFPELPQNPEVHNALGEVAFPVPSVHLPSRPQIYAPGAAGDEDDQDNPFSGIRHDNKFDLAASSPDDRDTPAPLPTYVDTMQHVEEVHVVHANPVEGGDGRCSLEKDTGGGDGADGRDHDPSRMV